MKQSSSEYRFDAAHAERLDRALAATVPAMSRTLARRLIGAGAVFVDGRRCRIASRKILPGARLRIAQPPAVTTKPPAALAVVFENDDYVGIDKPCGMPSAPTDRAAEGTAFETLRTQAGDTYKKLWVVHRLDAATSGLLVFARNADAAAALSEAFREHRIRKRYLALVAGAPDQDRGCIDLPLRRAGRTVCTSPDGQPACTEWRVLERRGERTLLLLEPDTGRMHQLRVHLSAIGHPIVGDRLYGGPSAPRLELHAWRLEIPVHAGAPLTLEAPPPARLQPLEPITDTHGETSGEEKREAQSERPARPDRP